MATNISAIGVITSILLLTSLYYSSINIGPQNLAAGQQDNLPKVPALKIISPEDGQIVAASPSNMTNGTNGNDKNNNSTLIVTGTATDDANSPCDVSILINDVRPYQPTTPQGTSGKDDYSNWQFLITPEYAPIKQGANKITAKLSCLKSPTNLTKWYSVNVTGGTQEQLLGQQQQLEKQQQQLEKEKLEQQQQAQLALRKIQLEKQREQQMLERAKVNAAKINQTEMFVTIESHEEDQLAPIGPLTISGISSDDSTTDCEVYLDWNDLKPFQKAKPNAINNTNLVNTVPREDFSNWTYTFTKDYHEIANGTNELTAKLSCLAYPNNYTKFTSVNITGAPQEQILQLQQQDQLRQQQMIERAKVNAAKINQTEMFVTIESHKPGQHVPMDSNLTISGKSSDDASTDCDVSAVLNSETPYQRASPIDDSETNNYSNWTFTFTPSYGVPKEGENEMTSRISCLAYPNNYTKFSSVNITGVPQDTFSSQPQQASPQPLLQHGGRQTNPNSYTTDSPDLPISRSDSINSMDTGANMINSRRGLPIGYS